MVSLRCFILKLFSISWKSIPPLLFFWLKTKSLKTFQKKILSILGPLVFLGAFYNPAFCMKNNDEELDLNDGVENE